jgi:hypothetical protein
MTAPEAHPCYISLHRMAKLTGRSRVTLLLRLKDGDLPPDALLDVGGGRTLPLFRADRVAQVERQPAARKPPSSRLNPML